MSHTHAETFGGFCMIGCMRTHLRDVGAFAGVLHARCRGRITVNARRAHLQQVIALEIGCFITILTLVSRPLVGKTC